jgi:hypothetical protein
MHNILINCHRREETMDKSSIEKRNDLQNEQNEEVDVVARKISQVRLEKGLQIFGSVMTTSWMWRQ